MNEPTTLLFNPGDLDPEILHTLPASISFDGPEYTFVCPLCSKAHTMVCMAKQGDPIVLASVAGPGLRGGFPSAGLDSLSGNLLAKVLPNHNAHLVAAVACPNTEEKELAKELDKRGEIFEGFRQLTKTLLDHYQPSHVVTLGRQCYELLTGRSIPDDSIYGAYTFLGAVPLQALPSPKFEMQAKFRKRKFQDHLERGLTTIPKRMDVSKIQLKKVLTYEDSLEATTVLRTGRFMYFDVEFAGNPYAAGFRLLCLAAHCPDQGVVYLWPEESCMSAEITRPLVELLADPSVKKGAHNAKAEWLACTQFYASSLRKPNGRTRLTNLYADSMLLVYLLGYGGQIRLSTCSEYVGLGGQKSSVETAVAGAGQLVRFLQGMIREGHTIEAGLDKYRKRLQNKLGQEHKKGLIARYQADGLPLKVCRVMAATDLDAAAAGGGTKELQDAWAALTFQYGNPVSSELLVRAVEDLHHEPERYTYGLIDPELLGNYCAKDVVTGCAVAVWAGKQVINTPGLRETWFDVMAPATEVISQMERNGLPTLDERLVEVVNWAQRDMATCQTQLRALGFEGELSKNADVGRFLFEKLGFEPQVFTDKGATSVAKEALEALISQAPESPVMKLLQEYNKASKVNDAFGEKLRQKIEVDGCIHGSFKTDGTGTGRLSASAPNLQQLPSHSIYAKAIKGAFVGQINGVQGVMIQLDFSQIELRMAAGLSQDPVMTAAFVGGEDFHMATAKLVWGGPGIEINKEQRSDAKKVNFGLLFNKTVKSLAVDLGKTVAATQAIKDDVMGKYNVLDETLRFWEKEAARVGYARTYWWDEEKKHWKPMRIRHLPDLGHIMGGFASTAKNASVNTPIQGSSGDITLRSLVAIDRWLEETGVDARIVLTVHDSIVLISSYKDALRVAVNCKRIMESWNIGGVPVVADCEIGLDYGHAYPLKDIIAGAAALSRGLLEEEAALIAGILREAPEFAILRNLAPDVQDYYQPEAA